MKTLAILILTLTFAAHSRAEEQSGLCEDLAKFSCSPGVQDDGTGVSLNGNFGKNSVAPMMAFDSKRSSVEAKFKKLFSDPDNAYLKKLATSALGLADSPACQSKGSSEIEKCSQDLISGVVEIAKKQIVSPQTPSMMGNRSGMGMPRTGEDLNEKYLLVQNAAFKKTLSEIENEIGPNFEKPEVEKRIKDKVFPQVKSLLEKKIKELPIDDKMKSFMVDKIKGIQYGGTDCEEMGVGLSKNFIPNAFYQPEKQLFKVCKGLISETTSDFHLVGVIAHELAHSIDPCYISIGPQSEALKYKNKKDLEKMDNEYPIQGLISCLRSKKSIHAVNFMATPANPALGGGVYPVYPSPPPGYFPPNSSGGTESTEKEFSYCMQSDQIGESMSDWFAADVLTDYIQSNHPGLSREQWQLGYSNVFRPICRDRSGSSSDVHPENQDRINAIILVNPQVRQNMGCTKPHSKYVYCDARRPDLLMKMSDEDKVGLKPKSQERPGGYGLPVLEPKDSKGAPMPVKLPGGAR